MQGSSNKSISYSMLLTKLILGFSLSQRQQKQRQLLGRLQDLLLGPKADEQTTCEVLDYFLRRLSSTQVASRVLAMKVFTKSQGSK